MGRLLADVCNTVKIQQVIPDTASLRVNYLSHVTCCDAFFTITSVGASSCREKCLMIYVMGMLDTIQLAADTSEYKTACSNQLHFRCT